MNYILKRHYSCLIGIGDKPTHQKSKIKAGELLQLGQQGNNSLGKFGDMSKNIISDVERTIVYAPTPNGPLE
jgi:hypothetical protein